EFLHQLVIDIIAVRKVPGSDRLAAQGVDDVKNPAGRAWQRAPEGRGEEQAVLRSRSQPVAYFFNARLGREVGRLFIAEIRADVGLRVRHYDHADADGGDQQQHQQGDD